MICTNIGYLHRFFALLSIKGLLAKISVFHRSLLVSRRPTLFTSATAVNGKTTALSDDFFSLCVSCGSRWVECSTALGGFRVLKKTQEAPCTTKLNCRGRTTRGTTQ